MPTQNDPKKKAKVLYMGNNPNSGNYNDNIPVGNNKWDEQEAIDDREDIGEGIEDEDSMRDLWDDYSNE